MRKTLLAILLTVAAVVMCGCGESYSEADIEEARQQGYTEGYSAGYNRGAEDRQDEDYDDFLIGGMSIRDLSDQVYKEYGMYPSEAFNIFDSYQCDADHGGYSWDEYQKAIEAMYFTSCIFPRE